MNLIRDKIKGMLLGGAIGDALGAPVEMWTPERIIETHGKLIDRYVAPIGHKWFKPGEFLPGTYTDDTQLTLATMQGFINSHRDKDNSFDHYLDGIANAHIEAMKESTAGWGKSTVESIRRLANGVHWRQSGKTTEPNRGTGNGVPMKIASFAAWEVTQDMLAFPDDFSLNQRIVEFSGMTHYSRISAEAAVLHANALIMLLWDLPARFIPKYFFDLIGELVWDYKTEKDHNFWDDSHLDQSSHTLKDRIQILWDMWCKDSLNSATLEDLQQAFGGGSCYVYDSLPFAYAFFVKNPHDVSSILAAANAGGDNDTNAKFVGEMIGALHGQEIFQRPENQWMLDGLRGKEEIIRLADKFCDTFGVS